MKKLPCETLVSKPSGSGPQVLNTAVRRDRIIVRLAMTGVIKDQRCIAEGAVLGSQDREVGAGGAVTQEGMREDDGCIGGINRVHESTP